MDTRRYIAGACVLGGEAAFAGSLFLLCLRRLSSLKGGNEPSLGLRRLPLFRAAAATAAAAPRARCLVPRYLFRGIISHSQAPEKYVRSRGRPLSPRLFVRFVYIPILSRSPDLPGRAILGLSPWARSCRRFVWRRDAPIVRRGLPPGQRRRSCRALSTAGRSEATTHTVQKQSLRPLAFRADCRDCQSDYVLQVVQYTVQRVGFVCMRYGYLLVELLSTDVRATLIRCV